MNQKQIGIILIALGLVLAGVVYGIKYNEDGRINMVIAQQGGSCYLGDGTCLHENQATTLYIVSWILSAAIFMLGIYLVFFDKTQQMLAENQLKVSHALKDAKQKEHKDEKFKAFLAGFKEDEQKVLLAIKDQDGIKQSTLRFKTGMSKTTLSLMLKNLEERDLISRKEDGKTNQVFLRKRF